MNKILGKILCFIGWHDIKIYGEIICGEVFLGYEKCKRCKRKFEIDW